MNDSDAGAERFEERMNQSDTTLWRIERDPALRTTIVAIAVLDRAPDWERLRGVVLDTSHRIPRLRQRVVDPTYGPPRWVPARDVDVDYHLRRVGVPAPGDVDGVLALGATAAMGAFDKDRPLWEFTLVDGLRGGRAAFLIKVHHSLTDGVGAMRLARLLFDDTAEGEPRRAVVSTGADGDAASEGDVRAKVALDTVADQARGALAVANRMAMAMPTMMTAAARDPAGTMETALRSARTVYRMLRPARTPLSPIMTGRGMGRRLAVLEVALADLLAAGHAVNGTLNDAFLAAVTGGLRRYHDIHGAALDRLRVTMPINLRHDDDAVGNNRFTPARFKVPAGEPDPVARMRQLGELARSWRREPGLNLTDVVAGTLNALPGQATTVVLGSMLKAIDFVATNIPGFDHDVFLAGSAVERQYAFAPPSGAAVSIALLSNAGTCTFGVEMDTAAVGDPDRFVECLREGVDEVVAVGRPPARAKRPRKRNPTRASGAPRRAPRPSPSNRVR